MTHSEVHQTIPQTNNTNHGDGHHGGAEGGFKDRLVRVECIEREKQNNNIVRRILKASIRVGGGVSYEFRLQTGNDSAGGGTRTVVEMKIFFRPLPSPLPSRVHPS
jgi:hypothetical protein